jgi:hypothetical protein
MSHRYRVPTRCSVEDCDRGVTAHGLCPRHYQRWRKYGDPNYLKPRPPKKPKRSTSGCNCGGPCFYCGRALSQGRHHHDHFPIPWRHGGEETVPACRECHELKDLRVVGLHRDGTPDEPVLEAVRRGWETLTCEGVRWNGEIEQIPVIVFWVYVHVEDPVGDWPYDWPRTVDDAAATLLEEIPKASTPEARIWLAQAFCTWLDRLDDCLREGLGQ